MAYAEVEDVKARAGVLADAWDDTTVPGDQDIERFIRDAAATVDIALAAHGFDSPATDGRVQAALTPVVADMALYAAMGATWPGGDGPAAVGSLYKAVEARVGGYVAALANGDIGFLMYLRAQEEGNSAGAANFWSQEMGYSSYLDDLQTGRFLLTGTGLTLRSPTGPGAHRDMKF